MKEPEISVGIVNAQEIHFSLNGNFFAKGETVCGEQQVAFSEGGILWNGNLYRELTFTPQDEHASFSLYDVTIGINFHWERQETQSFMGTLKLVVDEGKITAINILPAEDYLISVISSEMNATSSLEFLKAHAVVSRSWLFAQIEKRKALSDKNEGFFSFIKTDTEYIRWYDREDHTIFDVCADDHCQRYQGITKASSAAVTEAVRATRALKNGMTLKLLFDQLKDIRKEVQIPLVLMGYLNPIMQYGFKDFCRTCRETGIDGVIIPDLPFKDYMEEYRSIAEEQDVRIIMLITPETSEERIRLIDEHTDGFIYMVSSAAITGAQKDFNAQKQAYFQRIADMNLRNPRMIGFGISNKQTFETASAHAAGAIIGSKFVTLLDEEDGDTEKAADKLLEALKN